MLMIWGNIQKIIVQWIVWSHFCWHLSYIRGTWHSKSIERHAVPSGLPTSNPSFSEPISGGSYCYQFLVNPFRDVSCLEERYACMHLCILPHNPQPLHLHRELHVVYTVLGRDETVHRKKIVSSYIMKTSLLKRSSILVNLCFFFFFKISFCSCFNWLCGK